MIFTWSKAKLFFLSKGKPVAPEMVKAAANAAMLESRGAIASRTLELSQLAQSKGRFDAADLDAWQRDVKGALKTLHGANAALARGGFDQMQPKHWDDVQRIVAREHGVVERIAARAASGRYNSDLSNKQLLTHISNTANVGRSTYETTRLDDNTEKFEHDEFKRVLGDSDHCTTSKDGTPGCIEAEAMGWCSREEFIEIGDCACHDNCNCIAISRKAGQDDRIDL